MEEELGNKPSQRTKPVKTKVLMAFHVYVDDHKLFRQIAFRAQMSISELLRKSLAEFENVKFPTELLLSIMPQRGEAGVNTVTTTFNVSPRDRERLEYITSRHKIKMTDTIRAIMKKVVTENEGNIDAEEIIKNENKKRLDIEFPADVFNVLHEYALKEFTNLSEFIRLNFDKFATEDFRKYAYNVENAKENKTLYRTSISLYPMLITDIEQMAEQLNAEHGNKRRIKKVKKSDILGAFLYFALEHVVKPKKK